MPGLFDDVLQPRKPGLFDDVLAQPSEAPDYSAAFREPAGLGDIALRALVGRVPELLANVVELPANLGDAIGVDVPVLPALAEGIRNIGFEREMEAAGFGAPNVSGAQVVEALTPSADLPLGERAATLGQFIPEQLVASIPDMVATLNPVTLGAYIGARTNEIAGDRAAADHREDVSLGDLAAGGVAAPIEALLERFTTMRLLPQGTTMATPGVLPAIGRIARELGLQGTLGGVEELAPYLASTVGTETGVSQQGALETFAGGALAEGALGAGVQGGKEAVVGLGRRGVIPPDVVDEVTLGDVVATDQAAPPAEQPTDDLDELLARALGDAIDPTPAPDVATPTSEGQGPGRDSLPARDLVEALAARMRQSAQEREARTAGQPAQSPAAPVGSRPAGGDLADVPRAQTVTPPSQEIAASAALTSALPTAGDKADGQPTTEFRRQYRNTGRRDSKGRPIKMPVVDYSRDGLLQWLGAAGGVDFEDIRREGGADAAILKDAVVARPFGRVGFPAVRKQGGMTLDRLREQMQQDGWLPEDPPDAPPRVDNNDALDLIMDAVAGRDVFHPIEGAGQRFARQAEQMRLDDEARDGELAADLGFPDIASMYTAIEEADEKQDAPFDLGDYEEARSLSDLAEAAVERGLSEADVERIITENPAPADQAAALWQVLTENANAPDRRAARERGEGGGEARVAEEAPGFRLAEAEARPEPRQAVAAPGLFGAPTARDFLDARIRERDDARNGRAGTGRTDMAAGEGELFAGPRPVQARVDEPAVISFEQYAAQRGASRGDIGEAGVHKRRRTQTDKQWTRVVRDADRRSAEVVERRAALRVEYDAAVERGEIRPPSRLEKLKDTAAGHPDNAAVQAARRTLERMGESYDTPQDEPVLSEESDQTQTPEFRRWFGDSKVVDADGKPLVVYHGTTNAKAIEADGFKPGWVHLTDSKPVADSYQEWKRGDSRDTLALYVKAENPAYYDADGAKYTDIGNRIFRAAWDAEKSGHDALIIQNIRDHFDSSVPTEPHTTVVAFRPEQIKSATANSGAFDPDNPSILASESHDDTANTLTNEFADQQADERGLKQAVRDLLGDVPVQWIADTDTLPAALQSRLRTSTDKRGRKMRTKGLFDPKTGTVYLVTSNLRDGHDAAWTAAHEIAGHKGLRTLFRDKTGLRQALSIAQQNPTVAKLSDAVYQYRNYAGRSGGTTDLQFLAAEEALAELAAAVRTSDYQTIADRYGVNVAPGIRATVKAAIDNFIRRIKALFDRQGAGFSDAEVRELLEAAWQAAREPAATSAEAPLESASQDRIDEALQEAGIPVGDAITRDKLWNDGQHRFFGVHEQAEGEPFEITDYEALRKYDPEMVMALPRAVAEDYGLDDVLESVEDANARAEARREEAAATLPVSRGSAGWSYDKSRWAGRKGRMSEARANLQDKMLAWRDVQQQIESQLGRAISDAQNVYRLENLMHGRVGEGIDRIEREQVQPLMDAMQAAGVKPAVLEEYLYALHAKDRNAAIAQKNPAMPDGGSGMTNAEADAILAKADKAKLDPLVRRVRGIITATRKRLLANGLITQDAFDAMEADATYVPLRGQAVAEDADFGGTGMTGRGLDSRGKMVREALGRGAGNRATDILAEIIGDAERSVIMAEKARVGRAVMRLVLANPNPALWQVEPVQTERALDASGEVYEKVVNDWSDPSIVAVRHKGQLYKVQINSVPLAKALNHVGVDQLSGITRAAGAVNRYFSAILTKYNPAFTPVNATRDALFGLTGLAAEHGEAAALDAALHYPQAAAAAFQRARGKQLPGEWGDLAQRFAQAGGKTGYVNMPSTEDIARKIGSGKLTGYSPDGVRKAARVIGEAVGTLNDAVENALRLAAFGTLVKRGMSDEQAAAYAKDLTVNFNRKGFDGSAWNAWFLFYNASLQGAHRTSKLLRKPKTYGYLGMLAGAQVLATMAAMGMRDDNDELLWNKIPDHVKRRNIVIVTGDGGIVTIPMPYGFNLLPYLSGRMTEAVLNDARGDDRATDRPAQLVADTLSAGIESFSPVPLDQGVAGLLPTILRIPANVWANQNDFGRQIRREDPYSKSDVPRASMGRPDTLEVFKLTAKGLNRIGGGDDLTPPPLTAFDVAPEDLEYLLGELTGGPGKLVVDMATSWQKAGSPEPLTPRDVPITKRFVSNIDEQAAQQALYYQRREVIDRALKRVRAEYRSKGPEAAEAMLKATPELTGAVFKRRKRASDNGPEGSIIETDGRPQIVVGKPDSVFAWYKQVEDSIRGRNEGVETAYAAAPASILPTDKTRQRDAFIRTENKIRQADQSAFNGAWVRDVVGAAE